MRSNDAGLDRSFLSESFQATEAQKSNLILEASFQYLQGHYEISARNFARAAELESDLAMQLLRMGQNEKAFHHSFSSISCWARAGDLHRALLLGEELLDNQQLTQSQQEQVRTYLDSLLNRMAQWMRLWNNSAAQAAD